MLNSSNNNTISRLQKNAAYWSVPAVVPSAACQVTTVSQNIRLAIIQATHIRVSQIAAALKIANHFLYFSSSPAAVTIRNPPYINSISAISAKSQSIQLTAHLTRLKNCSSLKEFHQFAAHHTCISFVFVTLSKVPNQKLPDQVKRGTHKTSTDRQIPLNKISSFFI